MATVINNPTPVERTVVEHVTDSGAGWAVAVVVLVAVIAVGMFVWSRYYRAPAPAASGGTNINLTLPSTSGGTSATPAQ